MRKPKKVQFKVWITPSVRRQVEASAKKHDISLSQETARLIMDSLNRDQPVFLKPGIYTVS